MHTLTDLEASRDALQSQLDELLEATGGECTPEVDVLLDAVLAADEKITAKVDSYCHVIKDYDAQACLLDDHAKELQRRRDVLVNAVARMKARLMEYLQRNQIDGVQGEWHSARICGNGGLVPLEVDPVDVKTLPEAFTKRRIDFTAIRQAIEAGASLPYARLGERGKHLRVS